MSGVRASLPWRHLVLGITVLAAIAGMLLTLQVGHSATPSAADAHSAIPVLIHDTAAADKSDVADGSSASDEKRRHLPAGALPLQVCLAVLAGALGLLLKCGAKRPPSRRDGNSRPRYRTRTGTGISTSVGPLMPVLSSTCVLRV
ncbi:hypothetical protein [Rhodococcus sp. WAY2]|uniref:hypothetical protein n=1 Tax=Rhodococcus sp. WAY2 TaxID=2663121 RepID=UPI001357D0C6|nr:hypothetical protein [Rhodococcus sp. WAY2]